jgi:two-component system sensor histidine kinase/response regulator
MDVARGLDALLGRRERYLELLGRFVLAQTDAVRQMSVQLQAGDVATARFLIHSLKGAAAALGADGLAHRAAHLETTLRADPASPLAARAADEELVAIAQELEAMAFALNL